MKHQDVFRIMKRVLISELLVLGIFLFASNTLAQSSLSSTSLLNAYRSYVKEVPAPLVSTPPSIPEVVKPIPPKILPPPVQVSNADLASTLRNLLKQKEFVAQLRGPEGKEGPQGPQGSPGINGVSSNATPSIIYSAPPAPAANFSGASYFSATNITSSLLSADTAKVAELKVSSSLNVTGSSTLGAITVTSCTGCSPTTSLALSSAITDETGSGALVFSTSPTFITPVLGVATGTSLALGGGTALTTTNQTGTGNLVLATSPTLVTPVLGVASATSITTSGQGALQVGPFNTGAGQTGEGRFLELLANGTNYTGFKSPDLLASNVIYTLPSADGTSGQVLTTNGAGVLSWTTKTEGISQDFKGLSLRTSPNADVAATTVTLDHADEIVMDTGNRVTGWDDLSAVITTAGAGGLDTSSEAASTWYEIYAIRKSSDGTKNLLLHRAKDYFLDEQQTTQDNGASLRQASAPTRTQLAQGFQTSNTGYVEFVDLRISQDNGTISGRVWLTIEADSSGNPSGTPLATSDKFDAELVNTSSQWVRFVFRTPVSVTAATQYHLVLSGDYTPDDTVNIGWKADATGDYANGVWKSLDSGTWNTITGYDAMFKIYVTQNNTSVTLPSGYDQKAHVGYVYNGSDSNFIKFTAQGRHVWYMPDNSNGPDWVALSTSATVPTLTSLVAFVPPGPVRFIFTAQNDNATGSTIIGGVSSPGAGTSDYGGFYMIEDAANDQEISPPVQTEYQAFYMRALTAGTSYILPRQYEWGSGGGADLAKEYLVDDESISSGDVVSLTDEKLYVEKASMTGKTVLGIVSTKPGITLKDWPNDISPENTRPIALSGRVPVKISNENGEIKVGDRLTLSKTIPGYAMKQTDPGQSIGIAMEESTENIDKILVFVNLSYWAPGFGHSREI